MEKVTIEKLKAQLSSLPEGQTDLGALLVAAKVDLTVENIVGPPLTQVKKIMEARGLSEWQMTLCLKIRRRKKNTVRLNFKVFRLQPTAASLKSRSVIVIFLSLLSCLFLSGSHQAVAIYLSVSL